MRYKASQKVGIKIITKQKVLYLKLFIFSLKKNEMLSVPLWKWQHKVIQSIKLRKIEEKNERLRWVERGCKRWERKKNFDKLPTQTRRRTKWKIIVDERKWGGNPRNKNKVEPAIDENESTNHNHTMYKVLK